ncbi:MAG: helix-turn-helix transcriptional regulator [Candidatus Thermoplasmatota archaeon]|jgi:DNA-binding HxlR family transcriptional regulator|nr:helix-turn-helix transcriptional regulator [Candidatus Thermoplasmatota archaeon]
MTTNASLLKLKDKQKIKEHPLESVYAVAVIESISDGNAYGFNQIKKNTGYISSNTLSKVLGNLVQNGIVNRLVISTRPPHVEYSLTNKGLELAHIVSEYYNWSAKWQNEAHNYI